jgi:hypothetical protein
VIDKDIQYEESDHHLLPYAGLHSRLYPRRGYVEPPHWEYVPEEIIQNIDKPL